MTTRFKGGSKRMEKQFELANVPAVGGSSYREFTVIAVLYMLHR